MIHNKSYKEMHSIIKKNDVAIKSKSDAEVKYAMNQMQ